MIERKSRTEPAWSTEMDALLRDLIGMQFSFSEAAEIINDRFGTTFTRNAAIGRSHRKGFKTGNLPCGKILNKPKRVQIRGPRKPKPKLVTAPLSAAVVCEPLPAGVTLLELAPNGCRWPFGTGPYTFCNQPQGAARVDRYGNLHGCSYCDEHAAIAFGPGTTSERTAHYGVA